MGRKVKLPDPLVERTLTREQMLSKLPVPATWTGVRPVIWAGLLLGPWCLVSAPGRFVQGDMAGGAVLVALGLLVFWWACWVAAPTPLVATGSLVIFLGTGVLAAGLGIVLEAVWLGIAAAAVTAAGTWAGVWVLARRRRTAQALSWLAEGLRYATADPRPDVMILRPQWRRADAATGLPVTWNLPEGLPVDRRSLLVLAHEVSNRAGVWANITVHSNGRRAQIALTPEGSPLPPLNAPVDREVERVQAPLGRMVPGAAVKTLEYDADGKFERLTFSWPSERNDRVASVPFRGRLVRVLAQTIKPTKDADASTATPILDAKWDMANDVGVITPVPPLPTGIPHPPRNAAQPWKAAFGQFRDSTRCVWDLNGTLPHTLIVGGTGGGKTVLLLSLLTALPQTEEIQTQIFSIDPKRVGLKNLHLLPGAVGKAATRPKQMVDVLEQVHKIMDERFEDLENDRVSRSELAPVVLVVDEGEEMHDLLNEWWTSGEGKADWKERKGEDAKTTGSKHPVMATFSSIARLGREARVHIILASQQAAATWLSTAVRGQFAVRIALQNLSATDSSMIFGSPIASSGLELTPGRAWVATGLGKTPQHAQIYWTPKIERGLDPADRAILHDLGVTLPDELPEDDVAGVVQVPQPTAEDQRRLLHVVHDQEQETEDASPWVTAAAQATAEPTEDEETGPAEDEETALLSVPEAVASLEDGAQILVDTDAGQVVAVVESVEPDDTDPDNLVVVYVTTDGEEGALSLPDDDTVPVIAA